MPICSTIASWRRSLTVSGISSRSSWSSCSSSCSATDASSSSFVVRRASWLRTVDPDQVDQDSLIEPLYYHLTYCLTLSWGHIQERCTAMQWIWIKYNSDTVATDSVQRHQNHDHHQHVLRHHVAAQLRLLSTTHEPSTSSVTWLLAAQSRHVLRHHVVAQLRLLSSDAPQP